MEELLVGDELIDFAKTVTSKEEFEFFLQCLIKDYLDNRNKWENSDLRNYLEGLSGYVIDMEGYYRDIEEKVDVNVISWRIAAEMLIAASVYE